MTPEESKLPRVIYHVKNDGKWVEVTEAEYDAHPGPKRRIEVPA